MEYITPSVPELTALFPGYIKGIPVAYYGEGEAGKSIWMFQEACWIAKQLSKNILVIGTEGGEDVFVDLWFPVFKKRFDLQITECHIIDAETMEGLLDAFGQKTNVRISDTGKIDIRVVGTTINRVAKAIKAHDIGVVILDSLTMPFRTEFAGGRTNFSGRADAQCLVLGALRKIVHKELIVMVSHHSTIDPTNQYAKPTITGGKNILHNFKISLFLQKSKSTNLEKMTVRKLCLTRYFNKQGWIEHSKIQLTADGFVHYDDKKIGEEE